MPGWLGLLLQLYNEVILIIAHKNESITSLRFQECFCVESTSLSNRPDVSHDPDIHPLQGMNLCPHERGFVYIPTYCARSVGQDTHAGWP